ncbi:MAG: hypothetical protein JEY94_12540 [Melioribacteraceae bacterium]|nr:hypothetical protein [Melioribacteraceae bacterium]
MLFIIDKKLPAEAKDNLKNFGVVIELETEGITDSYLSGHPDIFFCKTKNGLVAAPNLPQKYFDVLNEHKIEFTVGDKSVKKGYPDCAVYNAVATDDFLIHKTELTDNEIKNIYSSNNIVNVPQGFTRCNLIEIKPNVFITSDKSIYNSLKKISDILYVNPESIILPDVKYGFFGGTCGMFDDKLFICGSLSKYADGAFVKEFVEKQNIEIIQLYEGQLFDGGSILIL